MVKLVCMMCGQVWYSAYEGGKCDYCNGTLVVARDENASSANIIASNVVSLSAKRAIRKMTRGV